MRRRKGTQKSTIAPQEIGEIVEEVGGGGGGSRFFACYLLTSQSPRFKGHTYIGFTVNPRRRIRQHNGEIGCGAWRTKRKRPWEMVLCIYGFPTNVDALQFEWAWQHPLESVAVRSAASSLKSLSGIANKIKLTYTMLSLPAWNELNLAVNFFSTKYKKHTSCCPTLPPQMRTQICSMEELPCYSGNSVCADDALDGDEEYDFSDRFDELNQESTEPARKSNEGSPRSQGCCSSLRVTENKISQIDKEDQRQTSTTIGEADSSVRSLDNSTAGYVKNEPICILVEEELTPVLDKRHVTTTSLATRGNDLSTNNPFTAHEVEVVDISTPSPCHLGNSGSKNGRAAALSEIIDLTMSPMSA